jgi:MYXO-CTERM domain-containing protein
MLNPLRSLLAIAVAALAVLHSSTARAQISWPPTQLLPSLPAPAPVEDLIQLHGASQQWQANDPALAHNTGRLDTDGGWLCQTGIDAPNLEMIYGPYVTTLPAGANTAQYELMIDNNTADNNPIVTLDVNDATSGQVLASQVITRTQFTVAAQYTSFSLPFTIPADNHSIELRVFWDGAAYTKVKWVGVTRSQADDELVLFASLKGIVNAKQPRIFSYEGDAFAEGPYTWLKSLGLGYSEIADNWTLIAKYQSEIGGVIVYDNSLPDTINLATTLAGPKKALLVAPSLVARLTAAPYNFPILLDLRGKFTDKLSVYQSLYTNYWPTLPHRLMFGLDPINVRAAVREYATAVGAAAVWLDPTVAAEQTLLDQFLSSMDQGSVWMGWWPSEGPGVTEASRYGVATVASDYCSNLTLHSGMPRTINVPPIPLKPTLQNKIFVGFILSDGDNLQYVEHLERKLWNDPGRGKVPMGWTMSPAMVDAMPGALDFYWSTATPNDEILSGPSGYGYTYPNDWTNAAQLDQFVTRTESYVEQAGFRIITVWNTITGGINTNVGDSYATNATSLLGVTAQDTGGPLTIYDNTLPGLPLSCNYCTGEQAMKDFIATASQGWDGSEPRFVMIQAQPWQNVTPTSFMNVAASLDANHVVVRPDHLFELLREAKGITINPIHTYMISASSDPNGSISPSGAVVVNQNDNQAFTFAPAPGYSVSAVSVDGVDVGVASYTFVNVTSNHTIRVSFSNGTTPDAGTSDAGISEGGSDATVDDASTIGTGHSDAGTPPVDGGLTQAGGADAGSGTPGTGCACRASRESTPSPGLLGVLGVVALVRRRRRA